jgi:hypothetical protein
MKTQIRVGFSHFWRGFKPDDFRAFFPFVYEKYDLVPSDMPEVMFHSVFTPDFKPYSDPRRPVEGFAPGPFVRVFLTGENFEPSMDHCDFAISFSSQVRHPDHLRLPLWVYENRGWGYGPVRLIKDANTDWEKVAAEKTKFCNYVYRHTVPYRERIFTELNECKRVDAAGSCGNNMNGWRVPLAPNRLAGKLDFFSRYKFTLALENMIWPGYMTEKIVDPMYVNSIPIYVGDPQACESFNTDSYIDSTVFGTWRRMLEFIREVDNDRDLYLKMLAAPFYRDNRVPDYARDERTLAFFDRIFERALARRSSALTPQ